MTNRLILSTAALALALLAGCNREVILQGERLDPRAVISPDGPAIIEGGAVTTTALSILAPRVSDWPQRGQNAQHLMGNAGLSGGTQRIWSANIGQPAGLRHRITADPVVSGGLVLTLDSRARVTATTTGGAAAWSADLTPAGERGDSVSGGGIALESGMAFVTTGYGELVGLDIRSGAVRWRQRVDTPVSGAPTVQNGVVYVAGRNGTGWAIRTTDGKVLWTVSGTRGAAGVTGVSAPASDGQIVVFPFNSGELLAADAASGMTLWTAQIAGSRAGRAIAVIRDVTGDPVIAGGTVIAGAQSGRMIAVDKATGQTLWNEKSGAVSPPLVVGGSVFAIDDENRLVRLDAATGGRIFAVDMPYYTDERVRRQDRIHAHYGPVMAGGRLFVASSDGILRVFDPRSGGLIGQGAIPGGAAAAPVVAGGVLYVVSRDGQLHAFR